MEIVFAALDVIQVLDWWTYKNPALVKSEKDDWKMKHDDTPPKFNITLKSYHQNPRLERQTSGKKHRFSGANC